MKTQYVLTEEEFYKLQVLLENIDADLGSIFNHPDDKEHVLKNGIDIDKSLNIIRSIFKQD